MQKTLPLFEKARFEVKLYTRTSPHGDPYSVGLVTDNNGNRHSILIDGKEFDLDKVEYLVGLDVRVQPTERGVRLRPLEQQPEALVNALIERLEKGLDPNRSRAPEFVDEPKPQLNKESKDDQRLSIVPALRELICWVGKECEERQLAGAGWVFFPVADPGGEYGNN